MENIIDAITIIQNEKKIVSISPSIDVALSGKIGEGIPEGVWVLLSGPPKCGKSTTALQIAANAQKQHNKQVFIGNVEGRIKSRDLKGIHDLDVNNIKIIQSSKGNILAAEQYIYEFIKIVKEVPGCVLVVDSTSALCEQAEMDTEIKADRRSSSAKLLASFCRQLCQIVPIQDTIVVLIQHMIANTGQDSRYNPFYESGGNKIQFQASVKLRCTSFKQKGVEGSAAYGQTINWRVHESAIGPPGRKIQSFLRYGHGIDEEAELIMLGIDLGLINKSTSWLSFQDLKAQGEEKMRQKLIDNPEIKQLLIDNIKDMM